MARAQRKQASSFFHSIPFYGMVVLISGKHKQEKQQNILFLLLFHSISFN